MIKYIKKTDIKNKVVLLRVDLNVDLSKANKEDSFRLQSISPTIDFLIQSGAEKIILMSHLSRPKGEDKKLSLKNILKKLENALDKEVIFLDGYPTTLKNKQKISQSARGSIFLLENIRFWPGEAKNSETFAKDISQLADVFINDSFATCHRKQASLVAITKFLPSFGGLLLKKELTNLSKIKDANKKIKRPLVLILGGVKISDKLPILEKFSNTADYILLGGGPANSVLTAFNWPTGKSLADKLTGEKIIKNINFLKKLVLPEDFLIAQSVKARKSIKRSFWEIKEKEIALDIGPDSIKVFEEIISFAGTVVWNGPLGYTPNDVFGISTKKIAQAIAKSSALSIVGGGDTIEVLAKLKLLNKFNFVSTGGGAMLHYLADEEMPGLDALDRNTLNK